MVDSFRRSEADADMMAAAARYRDLVKLRPVHRIELYADREADPDVLRYRVVRLDRDTFRAVIMFAPPGRHGSMIHGHDGSRETCRQWLTSFGIPVIRIDGPIPQAL